MSTLQAEPSETNGPDGAGDPFEQLIEYIDPRLRATLRAELARRRQRFEALPRGVTVVLTGHRAAGKSYLLPHVAKLLGRHGVDLDVELERRSGRSLRDWVRDDEPGFREAERACFCTLAPGGVVAVGGGFLSHHAQVLEGLVVVLVPVSFDTYAERLRADTTRPRLRPALSLDEELHHVYVEREQRHRSVPTLSLVDFIVRARNHERPRRVVTLPRGENPARFAWAARHAGADLLEIRTDLIDREVELRSCVRALPLLVSQRTPDVPAEWLSLASMVDRPLEAGVLAPFMSLHAEAALTPEQAMQRWQHVPRGTQVKHIEPLGSLSEVGRLFETRRLLEAHFGRGQVTVLPMGPLALPFRAVLARGNALDYLAADSSWAAAPGQRLLADAVREYRRPARSAETRRFGLLGHQIAHSRSPRIHRAPFDRIDLPADADVGAVLQALHPFYAGLAVTNPFKRAVARAVGATRDAVNTLRRTSTGWSSLNTDVEGARLVLDALGASSINVLGEGGVADALREAAKGSNRTVTFLKLADVHEVRGPTVWTWPASVSVPDALRFVDARVAVIAYGPPARIIARAIEARGGVALRLGTRWFVAQARAQQRLWHSSDVDTSFT